MNVVIGIVCLGVLILVHELGHFAAARGVGVKVESFSLGMGPVLLHKTLGDTDYRLSLVPFGGYCGMKGDKDYQDSLDRGLRRATGEPDSFYGVHPLKRVLIAVAGPFANVVFAVFSFTVIAIVGYTFYSADNRIILADEVYPGVFSEARHIGLETGDRILSIGGKPTPTFMDISQEVSTHPEKPLPIEIERQGKMFSSIITPILDKQSLSGKIGVTNWVEPFVAGVTPGSPAEAGGLLAGDRISSIDGHAVENATEVQRFLLGKESAVMDVVREGRPRQVHLDSLSSGDTIGFAFSVPAHQAPRHSLFPAIGLGFKETRRLVVLSVKGIAMLFRGGDFAGNVSGPVRLTVMMGETAKEGFTSSLNAGLVNTLNLMALISISLFLMNLLPIPVLDGGLVLFALIELVGRRPIRPKVQSYVQYGGIALIAVLFAFALFSDLTYLTGR